MLVSATDFNFWFSRYYSGDMTLNLVLILGFAAAAFYLACSNIDTAFWKIYLVASLCWTAAELLIQGLGTRTWASPPSIFSLELRFPLTAIVQGIAEGGVPTALSYRAARLLLERRFTVLALALGSYLIPVGVYLFRTASQGGTAVSHRSLSVLSIVFVTVGTAIAFLFIMKRREGGKLALAVFLFLSLLGLYLNLAAWYFGIRSVEYARIFTVGQPAAGFTSYSWPVVIAGIVFDSIIEFAGIYFAFYVAAVRLFRIPYGHSSRTA